MVTCSYCGTVFKLPMTKARSGGVVISGASVEIDGDVIGGNKIVVDAGSSRAANVFDGSGVTTVPPSRKLGWQEKIKRMFSN